MEKKSISALAGVLLFSVIFSAAVSYGQGEKAVIDRYLRELPKGEEKDLKPASPQRYRMTAIYTNRDLYGNFTGKQKITGDYTWGLDDGYVSWNRVFIAGSNSFSEPFPDGAKQEYMENIKYVPSSEMLKEEAFKNFPSNPENVFARNLIWDMMSIEMFAWDYSDSLKLNRKYIIKEINGEFNMGEIGTYNHAAIELCWTGISEFNGRLCAVLEYRAIDNIIELSMAQIKTRGTEQYWGTTWVNLTNKQIEYAEMYGGTIQEIEVSGMKDKFLIKTIRELWVERIN